MRFISCLVVLALAVASAGQTSAEVIVANTGVTSTAPTSFHIGGDSTQIEAVVWTQSYATTNTTITATIGSLSGSSELAGAYLSYGTPGNLINYAVATAPSYSSASDFNPDIIFSGLSLAAGTYWLTLSNNDTNPNSNVRWAVGKTTFNGSGTFQNSLYANSNPGNGTPNASSPYLSDFVTSVQPLGFSVSGTVVPEPTSFMLSSVGGAVLAIGAIRRRSHLVK